MIKQRKTRIPLNYHNLMFHMKNSIPQRHHQSWSITGFICNHCRQMNSTKVFLASFYLWSIIKVLLPCNYLNTPETHKMNNWTKWFSIWHLHIPCTQSLLNIPCDNHNCPQKGLQCQYQKVKVIPVLRHVPK